MKYIPENIKISVNGPIKVVTDVYGVLVSDKKTNNPICALYYDDEATANQVAQSLFLSISKSHIFEVL